MITVHIANMETTKARVAEYEAATKAGLQQQVIGTEVIWVKIKEQ